MCLAIPVKIVELLDDGMARVTIEGVSKVVSVALVDDLKVDDYVVLHVGYALSRIEPAEAERTLALLREAGALGAEAAL
ncbi:MAG: HypC/HybG/HupF family hydrogenase formation chaperone [Rhodoblastus sp.]|nr:HypC/HybG/HupF family hydrogenase formation chaperone [Rhodoblastus sp.]